MVRLFTYRFCLRNTNVTLKTNIYSSIVQLGSTYFTVAITGERLFAVIWPLESRSFCTYRNSKRLSVGIGIFSILSNSLMFYTTSQRQEVFHETNLSCQSLPPTDIPEYVNHLRLGIYVVVHYLFPLIAVILANVIIVRKVSMLRQD